MPDNKTIYKKLAALAEVETATKLIKQGLREIQALNGGNDFFHLPLLLLSNGFERLLKCLLCLECIGNDWEATIKPFSIKSGKGHNLTYLLEEIIKLCEGKKYSSKFPAAENDIEFLKHDSAFRNILDLLSDFGLGDRYYNIDIITKGESKYNNPSEKWTDIELTIKNNSKELNYNNDSDQIISEINKKLVIIFEKFARALSRLFFHGEFGEFAKQASSPVLDFVVLSDDKLGTKEY